MVISQSNNSFTPAKKKQPLRVSLVIIVSHSGLQWNLKVRQDDIRFLKVYIKLEETFDYYCTVTTALKVFDKLNMWFLKVQKTNCLILLYNTVRFKTLQL